MLGACRQNPVAVGGIFAVGDDKVNALGAAQRTKLLTQIGERALAHHVADCKQLHSVSLSIGGSARPSH